MMCDRNVIQERRGRSAAPPQNKKQRSQASWTESTSRRPTDTATKTPRRKCQSVKLLLSNWMRRERSRAHVQHWVRYTPTGKSLSDLLLPTRSWGICAKHLRAQGGSTPPGGSIGQRVISRITPNHAPSIAAGSTPADDNNDLRPCHPIISRRQ